MASVQQASKHLDKIEALLSDQYTIDRVIELRAALALMPMSQVLDKIYADTVKQKAELIGISRNTFYAWYRGEIRPNKTQAKRLEELTDIPAERFQGRR